MRLKLLVPQFRKNQKIKFHEQECINKHTKQYADCQYLDAFHGDFEIISRNYKYILPQYDGLIFGGSGDYNVRENFNTSINQFVKSRLDALHDAISYVIKSDFPTLGICFGHQLLSEIAGTNVIHEKSMEEAGFVQVTKTKDGKADPLFENTPEEFNVHVAHHESVSDIPTGATLLAKSKKCPIHALRYGNRIYSIQFHPEIDEEDASKRASMAPKYHTDKSGNFSFHNEPVKHQTKIISNFCEIVGRESASSC